MIFDESDLCNLIMQGQDIVNMPITVDPNVNIETLATVLEEPDQLVEWKIGRAHV